MRLPGQVNDAHAAFADLANDFVIAERVARIHAGFRGHGHRQQTTGTGGTAVFVVSDCAPAARATRHRFKGTTAAWVALFEIHRRTWRMRRNPVAGFIPCRTDL